MGVIFEKWVAVRAELALQPFFGFLCIIKFDETSNFIPADCPPQPGKLHSIGFSPRNTPRSNSTGQPDATRDTATLHT